jgi:hypothetical protein
VGIGANSRQRAISASCLSCWWTSAVLIVTSLTDGSSGLMRCAGRRRFSARLRHAAVLWRCYVPLPTVGCRRGCEEGFDTLSRVLASPVGSPAAEATRRMTASAASCSAASSGKSHGSAAMARSWSMRSIRYCSFTSSLN